MKPTAQLFQPDPVSGYITIFVEGKQHTIHATDSNFASAVTAFEASDWDGLYNILNPAQVFQNLYAKYEQIEVKHGNVYVNDEPISSLIAGRILDFLAKGVDCLPVFKFITKLNLNPSARAVNELYTFLEHKFLPLTDNGNFLAYKALRSDYTDVHTGKFNNSVDNVLEMPRNKVDDNKEVGCSYGFHAGTLEYARGFRPCNGKLVVVEINPADVVSIPTDCECQKLRTCKYKVHSEYEVPLEDLAYESRYSTEYDDDVDREWDDEESFHCPDCGTQHIMSYCDRCEYCSDCCECLDEDDDSSDCGNCDCGDLDSGGCMGDPDAPKTEVQLELNLDNKMREDDWESRRFNYEKMLNFLYSNRRPAVANALRNFYRDVDHQRDINPVFSVLRQFTSDEDVYKIYVDFTS
jgi:hypothetical protein